MIMAYHRARGESQRIRFVSREPAYHGVQYGAVFPVGKMVVKSRNLSPW